LRNPCFAPSPPEKQKIEKSDEFRWILGDKRKTPLVINEPKVEGIPEDDDTRGFREFNI
jgi:hypothetical protein